MAETDATVEERAVRICDELLPIDLEEQVRLASNLFVLDALQAAADQAARDMREADVAWLRERAKLHLDKADEHGRAHRTSLQLTELTADLVLRKAADLLDALPLPGEKS